MTRRFLSVLLAWTIGVVLMFGWCGAAEPAAGVPGDKVHFKKVQLDAEFRSEGVAIADINRDGKLDIAAGTVWYEAPDWKMHPIAGEAKTYDPKRYSESFFTFAEDLNHDGWPDLMTNVWPGKETLWFENPGKAEGAWKQHVATPVTSNESPAYTDVDGDGKRELVMGFTPEAGNPDAPSRRIGVARPGPEPDLPWTVAAISEPEAPGAKRYDHGLGVGDINGDGRKDVVVTQGWWEAPAKSDGNPWVFHPVNFGAPCAHMQVADFDGDGDADVLSSSAHAFGIWWHEQLPDGKWQTHEVDKSVSQTHALLLADINGDGLVDFVTGKRWWAHAQGDPGVNDPAVFNWYELRRENGRPRWIAHQFDHDSGPGTQFEIADLNGDGLLDIVTANKKGVHLFVQERK